MDRWRLNSLRLELIALILLVGVPVAALAIYSGLHRRAADEDGARDEAVRLARAYENHVSSQVTATKYILQPFAALLASIESLNAVPAETCQQFFAPMAAAESLELFGVIRPDGSFLCADKPLVPEVTLSDRPYIAGLPDEFGGIAVGVDQSPQTGNFVVPVFQPIRNPSGEYIGSLVAFLGLHTLTPTDLIDTLPDGSFATVIDGNGRIVARYPDPEGTLIGRASASGGVFDEMREMGSGSLNGTSAEGVSSILGFVPVAGLDGSALAVVGINRDHVVGAALTDLWRNSFGFLFFTGAAFGIAWVGSDWLVIRPVRRARQTALRFGAGDVDARLAPHYAHGEIGELGRSLDAMADAVVERRREIEELNSTLEERVAERTAELEAANEELEAFSYSVSHDLRAPLRAVDGFLQMALRKLDDDIPPEALQHLRRVEAGSQRMGALIDDLLQFSRVGRQELTFRTFSMDDLLRECLEDIVPPEERDRVQIEVGELGEVVGDRMLLRRVLDNLVGNALKFSRESDPPKIEIGSVSDEAGKAYFVRDNGVGFDEAYADKMFGMFQRLHLQEEYEGTGVGLAIVQRVMHKHGGSVWAKSAVGEGATFYFTLGEVGERDD